MTNTLIVSLGLSINRINSRTVFKLRDLIINSYNSTKICIYVIKVVPILNRILLLIVLIYIDKFIFG
jgi:hypothetical protein